MELTVFTDQIVAVVGNGPVDHDVSARIDSCPNVVRFNFYRTNPTFLSGRIGTKITHHGMASGHINKPHVDYHRNHKHVTRIGCVRPDRLPIVRKPYPFLIPIPWLETLCARLGKERHQRPTVGCMLLNWLLEVDKPSRILLVGFSWSNENMMTCHDLPNEHRLYLSQDRSTVEEL